jgi:hypothetical protein
MYGLFYKKFDTKDSDSFVEVLVVASKILKELENIMEDIKAHNLILPEYYGGSGSGEYEIEAMQQNAEMCIKEIKEI